MEFQLNDEHVYVRHLVREFVRRELAAEVEELDREHVVDVRLVPKMAAAGLLGISIPRQYGGIGGDHIALGLACKELEATDAILREVLTTHTAMTALSVLRWGTEEQKGHFLTAQARGARIGTAAVDIPEEGTASISTPFTAEPEPHGEPGRYVLHGEQAGVRLADLAGHFLILARIVDEAGLTAFLVEREADGVIVGDGAPPPGTITPLWNRLRLESVIVDASHRLGAVGQGEVIAIDAINRARYTIAAGAVGVIEKSIANAVRCIDERRGGARKNGYDQVRGMLQSMFDRADTARRLLLEVALAQQQGRDSSLQSALARWYASTAAFDSLADALRIKSACAEMHLSAQVSSM